MPHSQEKTLNGWREIGAFFGRNQSTVKRWAAAKGMPVYRAAGEQARRGLPVYAYPSELRDWLRADLSAPRETGMDEDAADTLPPAPPGRDNRLSHPGRAGLVLAISLALATGLLFGAGLTHLSGLSNELALVTRSFG